MPDHFYVYPAYLGRAGSRALGRRVPAGLSVEDVTVEQIAEAATSLGYEVSVEGEKLYPRRPYSSVGRVKVTKRSGTSKAKFLRELAQALKARPPPSRKA